MAGESAILWTRTASVATLVPEISRTPGFEQPRALPPARTDAGSDYTVRVDATGLAPGTRYFYRFTSGGAASAVGTFRTPPARDADAPVTLGFTGDADWRWKPYPLLASLAREPLDLFVFLGDLIYEWADAKRTAVVDDLAGYRAKYRENREPRPGAGGGGAPMRDLYAAFGIYAILDNHEVGYGRDPAGPPYPEGGARYLGGFVNKTAGHRDRIRAFREYQPVRDIELAGTGDARTDGTARLYRAVSWGANVELIVLDGRSYRDARVRASDDPEGASCARTMLGPVQLAWLQETLVEAQRRGVTWKVIVTPSPMQQLGSAAQVGFDLDSNKSWVGGHRCERNRLLAYIDAHAIDNVVFLTTDFHYTAINNLFYETVPDDPRSPRKPARNAFEIMTGPLGANAGIPPFGRDVGTKGLTRRAADRQALAVLNGEKPDAKGWLAGLAQAGLDPVGLEPAFPGLETDSIRTAGGSPGVAEPLAFASFDSYAYAVLTFDRARLRVQVKTMPNVPDPATLDRPEVLEEYVARRAEETLDFVVKAR
jgi:phosphodiesterase/alkaline phosphatase D-like protein